MKHPYALLLVRCLLWLCLLGGGSSVVAGNLHVSVQNTTSSNIWWKVYQNGTGFWTPSGSSSQAPGTTVTADTDVGFSWSGTRTVTVKFGTASDYLNTASPSGGYSINNSAGGTASFVCGPTAPPSSGLNLTNQTAQFLQFRLTTTNGSTIITIPPGGTWSASGYTNAWQLTDDKLFWSGDLGGWVTNAVALASWDPSEGATNKVSPTPTAAAVNPNSKPLFSSPTNDTQIFGNGIVTSIQQMEQSGLKASATAYGALEAIRQNTSNTSTGVTALLAQSIALGEVQGLTAHAVSNQTFVMTNKSGPFPTDGGASVLADPQTAFTNSVAGQLGTVSSKADELAAGADAAKAEDYRGGTGTSFLIPVGGYTYDLNPFADSTFSQAVYWIRTAILWLVLIVTGRSLLLQMSEAVGKLAVAFGSSGMSVGEALLVAGSAVASDGIAGVVWIAGKVSVILVALSLLVVIPIGLYLVVTKFVGNLASLTTTPFTGAYGPQVTAAIDTLDHFVPLGVVLSCALVTLMFPLVVMVSMWVGAALTRLFK